MADFHRQTIGFRLIIFLIIVALIFGILLIKLFTLQVINLDFYKKEADNVSKRSTILAPKRGNILDRTGKSLLATNRDTFILTINPERRSRADILAVIDKISVLTKTPIEKLKKKIPDGNILYKSVDILSNVDFSYITYIAEHHEDFPGVTWQVKPLRVYPAGRALAQTLGYVGEISEDELKVYFNKGYNKRSVIGKSGLELMYDEYLRGKEGLKFKRVDAQGKIVAGKDIIQPPELGKNLVVSLDEKIQVLTAKALGKRVGSAVVMKPATGEILAMVSYPNYDPNLFYTDKSTEVFSELNRNSYGPFLNRAIQASASPASTFKVVMTTGLLEEDLISLDKTILCTGNILVGNRKFNCHVLTGHGYVDMFEALAESCNVYFYTAGINYLKPKRIVQYCDEYGFGKLTEIDLPGELPGYMPSTDRVTGSNWFDGDTANFSIGQGDLQVTPIQLAEMMSTIVNEGVDYQPRVLLKVVDPITQEVIKEFPQKILKETKMKANTWKNLKQALRGVITKGTAAPVMTTTAVQIAGKTGTAQTGRGADDKHSWFVSYGPYNAPDPKDTIVVVVWVDGVNQWEWWAPKAANLIYHGIFANKTYEETIADLKPWYLAAPEVFD